MKSIVIALAGFLSLAGAANAQQSYPDRNVSLIVPFGAGATVDIVARSMAQYLSANLGQRVLVVNQPGAAGNIGAAAAARSTADGYTLLLATTGPAANNKFLYKDLNYDPAKDFETIAVVATSPVIITASLNAPFKTMKEMIEYAKAHPDKLNPGYPGNGTVGHITGELIKNREGLVFPAVQYKTVGEMLPDLMSGRIDVVMDTVAPYVAPVQTGRLRALAVGGVTRFPGLPDVPTIAEAGLPGLEANVFYALLAPRGTPADIVAKLNKAANDYLKTETTIKMLGDYGLQPNQSTPSEAKKYIADEASKWGEVIKKANINF